MPILCAYGSLIRSTELVLGISQSYLWESRRPSCSRLRLLAPQRASSRSARNLNGEMQKMKSVSRSRTAAILGVLHGDDFTRS